LFFPQKFFLEAFSSPGLSLLSSKSHSFFTFEKQKTMAMNLKLMELIEGT
jgi:hypothetical protein